MLVIKDQEYFDQVCRFAAMKGAQYSEWLWEQLWYLHTYADHLPGEEDRDVGAPPMLHAPRPYDEWCQKKMVVNLTRDSAPASFSFVIATVGGDYWFNGGLIYHGDQTGWIMRDGHVIGPDEHQPTFSVRIGQADSPWSIHT